MIDPVDVVRADRRANVRFQAVGAGGQFFAEEILQVRMSGQNGAGGDLTASRLVAEAGIQIGLIGVNRLRRAGGGRLCGLGSGRGAIEGRRGIVDAAQGLPHGENVIFGLVLGAGYGQSAIRAELIRTGGFHIPLGQERFHIVAQDDDALGYLALQKKIVNGFKDVLGVLEPEADDVVLAEPVLKLRQHAVEAICVKEIRGRRAGVCHVRPLVEGAVSGADAGIKTVVAPPLLVHAHGGDLRWVDVMDPVFDPLNIHQYEHGEAPFQRVLASKRGVCACDRPLGCG